MKDVAKNDIGTYINAGSLIGRENLQLALSVNPSLVRYEVVIRQIKPRQPSRIGITWFISRLSSCSFFTSTASSMFSKGTTRSTMVTHLIEPTISCSLVVCWCDVGREKFFLCQMPCSISLEAAMNSWPSGLLTSRAGISPSWSKLMHGSQSWMSSSFATPHWLSDSSANVASTAFDYGDRYASEVNSYRIRKHATRFLGDDYASAATVVLTVDIGYFLG